MFRIQDLALEIEVAACAATLGGDGVLTWAIDVGSVRDAASGATPLRLVFRGLEHPDDAPRNLSSLRWVRVNCGMAVLASEIALLRTESDQFELSCSGLCGRDGARVPFSIQAPLKFDGIRSYITDEDAARRALAYYCEEDLFAWLDEPDKGRALFLPLLD